MNDRNEFAARAMQSLIIIGQLPMLLDFKNESEALESASWTEIATYSFRMADAMILESEKGRAVDAPAESKT